VPARDIQCGAPAVGLEHGISSRRQRAMRQTAQLVVVLDHQHRAAAVTGRFDRYHLADVLRQRRDGGEVDLERRPLPGSL